MLIVAGALVLIVCLLAAIRYSGGSRRPDMGSVSHQWIAAHRAAEPASST